VILCPFVAVDSALFYRGVFVAFPAPSASASYNLTPVLLLCCIKGRNFTALRSINLVSTSLKLQCSASSVARQALLLLLLLLLRELLTLVTFRRRPRHST